MPGELSAMVILSLPFIMECPVPGQGRAGRVPDGSGLGKGKKEATRARQYSGG